MSGLSGLSPVRSLNRSGLFTVCKFRDERLLCRTYFLQSIMEGNSVGSAQMDVSDSRKRPLDTDSDHFTTKRSNYNPGERY